MKHHRPTLLFCSDVPDSARSQTCMPLTTVLIPITGPSLVRIEAHPASIFLTRQAQSKPAIPNRQKHIYKNKMKQRKGKQVFQSRPLWNWLSGSRRSIQRPLIPLPRSSDGHNLRTLPPFCLVLLNLGLVPK
jgi:hypothetical protein